MIFLITPTGCRPDQINLCAFYMKRQTYTEKVVWIIVDDCYPLTTNGIQENFRENWMIIKAYPQPHWIPGLNTQGRNLSVGTNIIHNQFNLKEIEAIFIIEDDDYYKPHYLQNMMSHLNGFQATGERHTIYYNVLYRTHFTNPNVGHSSLFQTAFMPEVLPLFEKCYIQKFIDMNFWSMLTRVNLFNDNNLSVGIKGIPGRYGIGAGHTRLRNMPADNNWNYLRSIIGVEDAKIYERYYRGSGQPQHQGINRGRI